VLVESYNYEDIPEFVEMPDVESLSPEIKQWLNASKVVQSDKFLLRFKAWQLKLFTKRNLLKLADKTAKFCKYHRLFLFLIQYNLQTILQYPPQDALTTLFVNGECPGRSHLGCALLRANNVPARVVLAMPTRYEIWYEMHYMMEYYSDEYDWTLTEVHGAQTPYPPQNQIILRICYPEDENDTQADFMYPRMKGIERWLWINNENIKPYYKDCKEGSKIKSFNENTITIDSAIGQDAIYLTQEVFDKYQAYLGVELIGENLTHFQLGEEKIDLAINELETSDDAFGYIYYMNKAIDEFEQIST
jgi:hypothetical protein